MTATLLSRLGQVHPVLKNLSGVSLVQDTRAGLQRWLAARRIRKLWGASKQVKWADGGKVLCLLGVLYPDGLKKFQDAGAERDTCKCAPLSFGVPHLMKAVCAEPYCPGTKFRRIAVTNQRFTTGGFELTQRRTRYRWSSAPS